MGKPFEDPEWRGSPAFGKDEWELRKEACDALYPDEELAFELTYSLIDTENQSNGVNNRKGIVDALERVIKFNFYKDEDDATAYYRKQLERKRNLGGAVNERFFTQIHEEGEEFEDVPEGT